MEYAGFGLNDIQSSLIEYHLSLVLKANETTNLTRILDYESGRILHIEDSLAALPECIAAPEGRYADMGSGGGFPGIPLAIATSRETVLIESVKKKADFLSQFIRELQIDSYVSVFPGRTEEIAKNEPESFSLITARALSALPSLLELASPLLQMGGCLVAYKSGDCENELQDAFVMQHKVGFQFESDRFVQLSDGRSERRILVFIKVSDPLVSLPRRPGMAQKRPYRS